MKTLGRVLVILTVFAIVMGMTYFTVNAGSSSSSSTPAFQRGGEGFRNDGARPENRNEGRRGSMMFGLLKNTILVAFIVVVIAFPKSLIQQRRRIVPVRIK
jgi:hypothetical protein